MIGPQSGCPGWSRGAAVEDSGVQELPQGAVTQRLSLNL